MTNDKKQRLIAQRLGEPISVIGGLRWGQLELSFLGSFVLVGSVIAVLQISAAAMGQRSGIGLFGVATIGVLLFAVSWWKGISGAWGMAVLVDHGDGRVSVQPERWLSRNPYSQPLKQIRIPSAEVYVEAHEHTPWWRSPKVSVVSEAYSVKRGHSDSLRSWDRERSPR